MTRQDLLLVQTMEEAAEVVQGVSKCLRFSTAHEWPALDKTAEARLIQEIVELLTLVEMCQKENVLSPWPEDLEERKAAKRAKVEKYLTLSTELGKLS